MSPGFRKAMTYVNYLVGKTNRQGAQTTIFAAVSEERMNGRYLSDCRETYPVFKAKTVGDADLERKLYKETKNFLSLK